MQTDHDPIIVAQQGSFYVGGRQVKGAGSFSPEQLGHTNKGNTFWVDHLYVQYQIPLNARKYPLVLVHGGSGTGRVWETTPDGREGYQTIFLRRGFPVYIVDMPRRGRAGFPSFNGAFGRLDDRQIVPETTVRTGMEYAWTRWRLGPKVGESYADQQFPMQALEQFSRHLVPMVSDDAGVMTGALIALLEKIGPSVVVTHSQSGLFGWLAGARSANVAGVVSYEPGFVFPANEMPAPIPLYKGAMPAGTAVTNDEFATLARVPLQVVYGDNIVGAPIPDLIADGRRAQVVASKLFATAIRKRSGTAEILHLADAGLRGNSHFMFSDLNNVEVADQLSKFLSAHALDVRERD